jgi:hypothetical protein
MKVNITGASNFVNRMFEACGPYQWAREFLKNSLEAGATKVKFGIEWQAVKKYGVYRRTIIDNGSGMSKDELLKFFSTLGEGAKKIGGVHDNFGVGAKIASLPWNPDGVVVIAYKDGVGSMIQIVLEPTTGDYELVEFETQEGRSAVIDPSTVKWESSDEIDWSNLRPEWLGGNGTIIVLMGSETYPDTILGNPDTGESSTKGLSIYLNTRFWDLSGIDVVVAELRSERKNFWPSDEMEKDDAKRPNNRTIKGARFYLKDIHAKEAKLTAAGTMLLDNDRVKAEWYLWEGKRPDIHMYAKESGYIAIRYDEELFQLNSGKVQFRWFGVVESKVQQNLTIILEPQHYRPNEDKWGVHPDQSRNRLLFTGDGEKGVEPPLHDWGLEFSKSIPEAIWEAIMAARGENTGSLEDEEYRKRLQDKFGARWTMRQLVMVKPKREQEKQQPATESPTEIEMLEDIHGIKPYSRRKRNKAIKRLVSKAYEGNDAIAVEKDVVVDVPRFRYGQKEDFEKEWHIALWDEPNNEVVLNKEAPVLLESIKYHQEQYPEVYAEEVATTIQHVFGEVAVAKIAHSQKLKKLVSDQDLQSEYRNEKVLTIALMGLLAEESLISQRLGKFGRKKAA